MRVLQFVAVLALFAVAGPALSSPLVGRNFEAVRIGGSTVTGEKTPTFAFDGARVTGTGGCNQYGATAVDRGRLVVERRRGRAVQRIARGGLRVGAISSTRMYCGPGSAQEARFFELLDKTRAYRLARSELRLLSGGRRPRVLMVLRAAD